MGRHKRRRLDWTTPAAYVLALIVGAAGAVVIVVLIVDVWLRI